MDKNINVLVAMGNVRERGAMSAVIKRAPGITLAGATGDNDSLIGLIEAKKPDALLLDMDTFGDDPVVTVSNIMRQSPLPIILMSSRERDTVGVFEAISAGALTVVKKPVLANSEKDDKQTAKVLRDIKTYSEISVIRHVRGGDSTFEERRRSERKKYLPTGHIVVIASSTGGPQALKTMLCELPAGFPAGIVVAQHISQGFTPGLIEWLDGLCAIKFKEGVQGEKIKPGIAYFAPDGFHITVKRFELIGLDSGPTVGGHRPSCNMLLKSAADVFGEQAIGVILSGMGEDGAIGLKAIRDVGGKTFAQDEASCAVFGMPRVALEIGAVSRTTPLNRLAEEIVREVR